MQGELPDSEGELADEAEPAGEALALARHWVLLGGDAAEVVEGAVDVAVATV